MSGRPSSKRPKTLTRWPYYFPLSDDASENEFWGFLGLRTVIFFKRVETLKSCLLRLAFVSFFTFVCQIFWNVLFFFWLNLFYRLSICTSSSRDLKFHLGDSDLIFSSLRMLFNPDFSMKDETESWLLIQSGF